ncbi:aldo/keto reductase [Tunturiibacter lichenicola]|uniref:aldo/keto reductase n=1 Tax=Tunturiibacter lichenicola TaxID=2051959 RepID=UPI003D9ACA19
MKYSALGKTGVNVSTIGFGTVAFGDEYGTVSLEDCRQGLMYAIDAGINLVDTSPYYGRTLSEERLGAVLDGRRHEVVLGTKCGRYGFDQFDFSEAAVVRGLEGSLRRLRTEYVDVLQAHDVEFGSIEQIIHETIPAMHRLKEQGKVRFIGVTGYWPRILAYIAESASIDVTLNYCHWNLMMDDMDVALTPVANRQQIGLMNGSPLHMGLLGGNGGPPWHPAPAGIKAVAAQFAALCGEYGTDPALLALHACFQHPSVATTVVGPRNVDEVNDALEAMTFRPSAELMQKVSELMTPTFNTSWPSGLPENQPTLD